MNDYYCSCVTYAFALHSHSGTWAKTRENRTAANCMCVIGQVNPRSSVQLVSVEHCFESTSLGHGGSRRSHRIQSFVVARTHVKKDLSRSTSRRTPSASCFRLEIARHKMGTLHVSHLPWDISLGYVSSTHAHTKTFLSFCQDELNCTNHHGQRSHRTDGFTHKHGANGKV